jgi:hypothetical protein
VKCQVRTRDLQQTVSDGSLVGKKSDAKAFSPHHAELSSPSRPNQCHSPLSAILHTIDAYFSG